jgi:hypothetical protein
MLSWRIGEVTVTRVVEMEMPIVHNPRRAFLAEATPEALREIPWLFPHYVTPEGHLRLSIHALLVEAPGLRLVVDTCIGNDRPRQRRRRRLHPPARGPCGLEHHEGGRPLGSDLPEGPIPDRPAGIRPLERR